MYNNGNNCVLCDKNAKFQLNLIGDIVTFGCLIFFWVKFSNNDSVTFKIIQLTDVRFFQIQNGTKTYKK